MSIQKSISRQVLDLTCQLDGGVIDKRRVGVDELSGILCSLGSTEMVAGEKSFVPEPRVSRDLRQTWVQRCHTVDLQGLCHHPNFEPGAKSDKRRKSSSVAETNPCVTG